MRELTSHEINVVSGADGVFSLMVAAAIGVGLTVLAAMWVYGSRSFNITNIASS